MALFGKKKKRRTAVGQAPAEARVQPVRKRRRKRHKSNRILYYILVLLILAIVGVALSLTVFFKITEVSVTGTDKYPAEELERMTGISVGDNLLRADLKKAKENLMVYPYVEAVTAKRAYPPAVEIVITEAVPMAAFVEETGGCTLVSAAGRLLERGAPLPEGVLPILGVSLSGEEGDYPAVAPKKATEEETARAAAAAEAFLMTEYLLDAMEESGLTLELADFTDRFNIMGRYSEDITVEFGSESELARKMKLVREVIDNQLSHDFVGVLYAGTEGKVWADPENTAPEISIPDHYVFDEETGTYVDPAELAARNPAPPAQSEPEEDGEERGRIVIVEEVDE